MPVGIGRIWPFGRKRPPLSREDSLNSLPARNEALSARRTDAGEIEITLPRKDVWWVTLLSKFTFVPTSRKVVLDEIGTFVWDLCDGKTTVRELIEVFAKRYKLPRREAEVSITNYLKILLRRRLIGIGVVPTAANEQKETSGSQRRKKKRRRK